MVLVFAAGIVALSQFNRELIPPIEFPQTVLIAFNPGQDSEVMLNEVTIPLEEAVSDIEGVVNVESTTSDGLSVVVVMSEFGMDQEAIRGDIQERIDVTDFPDGMDAPDLLTFSLSDLPIISSSASSPDLDISEIKVLVENEIVPQLETIDGVAAVGEWRSNLPTELPPTPLPTEKS
jgi:HAE1 family hydrophobic/amphiphilic exporter-1